MQVKIKTPLQLSTDGRVVAVLEGTRDVNELLVSLGLAELGPRDQTERIEDREVSYRRPRGGRRR